MGRILSSFLSSISRASVVSGPTKSVAFYEKSLSVGDMRESVECVNVQWDVWEEEVYKRRVKVYGRVRRWTLRCHEKGVTWADSAARHLQDLAGTDTAVHFVVSEDDMHSVDTSVHALGVDVGYKDGVPSATEYRRFTVRLQEA